MKITITLVPQNAVKDVDIQKGSTVCDLIRKMNLKPDAVIVLHNNRPIPIDETLDDQKNLHIIQVASGG